ncbi:hypothetical protein D0Y65_051232 [Glycine soja]|uniref:Uncharacterized protein n=1 Tax=Glycine soja TaxID=3848 RepID=A0A445FFB2_GLYSO|nr:hypothetical protein D0Y65_051232 [Glycine soja]RZB47531.1 hypothetical protein D0Y65_051232 [Glycine soja]RZB47532.1 hypothetical protein D0Y65_051232 [Glycine soja]RZB47533.1 hypothetical protein D0Y65_051232 [Glycine soja]
MSALITPGLSAITAVIRVRVRVRVTYDIRNGSSQLLYDLDWRVREPGLFPAISDSSYQHVIDACMFLRKFICNALK